jgi:hypothetical protein
MVVSVRSRVTVSIVMTTTRFMRGKVGPETARSPENAGLEFPRSC